MTRKDSQGRRLCTATTNKGEPCRGPALIGATVCRKHGGSLPEVKAKSARIMLEELIHPALLALKDIIEDVKQPASARVAAARDILDRTGHKPAIAINVMPSLEILEGWLDEEIADGS